MTELSNKKNYLFSFISSSGVGLVRVALGLVSVPIAIGYWKNEVFSIWLLLTGLLGYLSLSNLGVNQVATILIGKSAFEGVKKLVLRRTFVISSLATLVLLLVFIGVSLVNPRWVSIIGDIPTSLFDEVFWTAVVLVVSFLLTVPFSLITSFLQGIQKLYVENVFTFFYSFINFLALLVTIAFHGNLVFFALVNGIGSLVFLGVKSGFAYWAYFRRMKEEDFPPDWVGCQEERETTNSSILRLGGSFLGMGIATTITASVDIFLVSNLMTIGEVSKYSITYRIFAIFYTILMSLILPAFPLIAREFGKGNWDWVNRVTTRTLEFSCYLGGAVWVFGVLFTKTAVGIWVGPEQFAGSAAALAFGGTVYLACIVVVYSNLVTVFNLVKGTELIPWLEIGLKLGLSFLLVKVFGLAGIALAALLAAFFSGGIFMPYWLQKKAPKLEGQLGFVVRYTFSLVLPFVVVSTLALQFLPGGWIALLVGGGLFAAFLLFGYLAMSSQTRDYVWKQLIEKPLAYVVRRRARNGA